MKDLTGNVYSASVGSMQAPQIDPGRFGNFDFSRAMALGMEGWKKYVGLGIGTTIVWFILFIVAYFLSIVLIGLFIIPHLAIGPVLLGYHMVRGTAEFSTLFRGFHAYGRVLAAFIILTLMFLPLIALMVGPIVVTSVIAGADKAEGIGTAQAGSIIFMYVMIFALMPVMYYVMGRLCLVFPLVVERGYRAWDAIKTSWEVTKPYQWWLMLMTFITQVMGQIGIYLCGVGMLFTFPLAQAFMGGAITMLLGEDDGRPLTASGTVPAPLTTGQPGQPGVTGTQDSLPGTEQPRNPYT